LYNICFANFRGPLNPPLDTKTTNIHGIIRSVLININVKSLSI